MSDSNWRPSVYKTDAATTELIGRGVGRDLNPHKPDSQSGALTNYATYTVAVGGFEPPTTSLWEKCSTNWTIQPRRKVQDSNLWRFYPQRLAIFCITTLPTFRILDFPIKRNWNDETWTRDRTVISRVLYQLSYIPLWGLWDSNPLGGPPTYCGTMH